MRHRRSTSKFGRDSGQRKALYKGLANSVLEHEKITTTLAKAKVMRPRVEKLITLAKVDNQHNRRLAFKKLQRKAIVTRLFDKIGPRFKDRPGGYLRIIKLGHRAGDGAEMAQLEMV